MTARTRGEPGKLKGRDSVCTKFWHQTEMAVGSYSRGLWPCLISCGVGRWSFSETSLRPFEMPLWPVYRERTPIGTPEGVLPDMLVEASSVSLSPSVTTSPTDTGLAESAANIAEGNSQPLERNASSEVTLEGTPPVMLLQVLTTSQTATTKTNPQNIARNPGVQQTYPKRHHKCPDWYHHQWLCH